MEKPVGTIRALRRVAASELSLDAPIGQRDRDSASFGERFSGAEASDIEETVDAIACRDFLETMFEQYLTEREREDPLPVLRPRRRRGEDPGGDRIASRRHTRAHQADPEPSVREAPREPARRIPLRILERELTQRRPGRWRPASNAQESARPPSAKTTRPSAT